MAVGNPASYGSMNELQAALGKNGISRPNRYIVTLFPPAVNNISINKFTGIMGEALGDGTVRATGLRCESISFPGRSLNTTDEVNIYGPNRKIVTGVSFGDISATFQCDETMREKLYFEAWQSLSHNPDTFTVGYYNNYVGSVEIAALSEDSNRHSGKTYGVKLIEAFPVSILEQGLSYQNGATYQTITVNFAYRYWENLDTRYKKSPPTVGQKTDQRDSAVARRLFNQKAHRGLFRSTSIFGRS
jgi:hypothetical protein